MVRRVFRVHNRLCKQNVRDALRFMKVFGVETKRLKPDVKGLRCGKEPLLERAIYHVAENKGVSNEFVKQCITFIDDPFSSRAPHRSISGYFNYFSDVYAPRLEMPTKDDFRVFALMAVESFMNGSITTGGWERFRVLKKFYVPLFSHNNVSNKRGK